MRLRRRLASRCQVADRRSAALRQRRPVLALALCEQRVQLVSAQAPDLIPRLRLLDVRRAVRVEALEEPESAVSPRARLSPFSTMRAMPSATASGSWLTRSLSASIGVRFARRVPSANTAGRGSAGAPGPASRECRPAARGGVDAIEAGLAPLTACPVRLCSLASLASASGCARARRGVQPEGCASASLGRSKD
jgi:hypothetical protein